jgi:hypothetical protein
MYGEIKSSTDLLEAPLAPDETDSHCQILPYEYFIGILVSTSQADRPLLKQGPRSDALPFSFLDRRRRTFSDEGGEAG